MNDPKPMPKPEPSVAMKPDAELEERIRIRAFELFELRNREPGHAVEDWLRAEAEIVGRARGQ